jgi:hypothetical protein
MRYRGILPVILILICAEAAFAPPLRLRLNNNSDWDLALDVTGLTGTAGSDFATNIESDPAAQQIWLQNATGNWQVSVSRVDAAWNAAIRVFVRRTSDGTAAVINGGTLYQEITTTDSIFFEGTGDAKDVSIQFMTNGAFAAAGVSSGAYSTTVTYTLTDNL